MPDIWMDVDVALAEVPINKAQLIDDTDFKTPEESVVYNQSGLDLVWNFVTTAGAVTQTAVTPTDTGGAHDFVAQGNGFYTIEIPASSGTINNDTEGFGWFAGFATGILPWIGPIIGFRLASLNNSLIDGPVGITPSTQDQVGAIGTTGGGALNFPVADDNVDGALNSITFVGVQTSGTFVSTEAIDGTNHIIDDDTNNIDIVYQFNIGGGRIATQITWTGFLSNNGDSINIQAYDFIGTDWETRVVLSGKNQSVNEQIDIPLFSKHTGTGANIGIVYIRFVVASATNPTLETDGLICAAVSIGQTVGYSLGAIWLDTDDGVSGTEAFVNGVADNPARTLANVITLSASTLLHRFVLTPDSAVTFGEAHTNEVWEGEGFDLALGGQDISGCHFTGADVSGTGTGSTEIHFDHCEIGIITIAEAHFDACDLEGVITLSGAVSYSFIDCAHGGGVPTIDFGSGVGNTTVHVHNYHGALLIKNMGQNGTDVLHFTSPDGKLTLDNTNIGGTVNLNGTFDLVNNGSGQTINAAGHISQATISSSTAGSVADYGRG